MLAVAGVCGAAAPPAPAACSLELVLTACIEMTVPSNATLGALDAGATTSSPEQAVEVSSNQSWGLKIASDSTDGRMREWTGSAYVANGAVLSHPLQWGLTSLAGVPQAPAWTSLSSTAATVVSGRPATACVLGGLCATETVGVTYRQAVSFADPSVAGDYRLAVTYTAQHGF